MSETGPGEAFLFPHAGPQPAGAESKAGAAIQPITMPKWGLAMEEGQVARWTVEEGAEIAPGQEIMDIETTKIANVFESPVGGILRRKVVGAGETAPVGALLGVVSDPAVPDAEVDRFVGEFQANFKPPEAGAGTAAAPEIVEVKGKKIRHLKAGPESADSENTPILFIHGFGSDMTSWMFNQAALAEDRPAYAVDLPGHGGSAKDVEGASAEALAAVVLDYMDAVGLKKAHLVGHSLGGAIATQIALVAPDRVEALTLIAPVGFGPDISEEFVEGLISETRARKLRPILEMLVANPALVTAEMVEDVLRSKRLDGASAALRAIADANFRGGAQQFSLRERLGDIRVPVRIVWGEADRILPARHAEGLPENVTVLRIAGAGHLPHMEKAADVNALLRAV